MGRTDPPRLPPACAWRVAALLAGKGLVGPSGLGLDHAEIPKIQKQVLDLLAPLVQQLGKVHRQGRSGGDIWLGLSCRCGCLPGAAAADRPLRIPGIQCGGHPAGLQQLHAQLDAAGPAAPLWAQTAAWPAGRALAPPSCFTISSLPALVGALPMAPRRWNC